MVRRTGCCCDDQDGKLRIERGEAKIRLRGETSIKRVSLNWFGPFKKCERLGALQSSASPPTTLQVLQSVESSCFILPNCLIFDICVTFIISLTATMADVRSMLKNERAARRIQHKYASYSTSGTLLCTVCRLQLKSESLWDGHLRSAGHIMRSQKLQEAEEAPIVEGNTKKRKASDGDEEAVDTLRKRTKSTNPSLPEGFFDPAQEEVEAPAVKVPTPTNEVQMKIPSRPATPLKTTQEIPSRPDVTANVDEDEWAAFEADIAAAEAQPVPVPIGNGEGVISAPAMTAAELKQREADEDNKRRRERMEAEAEGDKEDAARKLEEEFEEMESLEERVRRLREKREALRTKESKVSLVAPAEADVEKANGVEDDENDDEDYDDDGWDGFRMKG
jgi:zinc finger protein 830